ncbi:XRE family transcriptional regulator [Paraburkholderia bannensis]|uniref:XRE family transcriptional regulator n=1 Tax=Paraburkholderia bannensis TaxID=765414 RepID=UPI002ABE98DB|nr:XRE family transcriptional regulator [Paraburkholderia bannensis]
MQTQTRPTSIAASALRPNREGPAPRFLPDELIAQCASFRDAVWLAWENRVVRNMTKRTLAEQCGLYAPHVTNFINEQAFDSKGKKRADLPADKIHEFELVVGNQVVSQWLIHRAELTLLEVVIANKR